MTWKKRSSDTKYFNRYMIVTEDIVVNDHGDQITYGVVRKEPVVMIVPWDGDRVTLICQYRYPIDQLSWEFPAGHMEHNNLEAAAKAELEEESGLLANKLTKIGVFAIAPGHNTQICHTYLATGLSAGTQNLEVAEKGMKVKSVTLEELDAMIRNHEIVDGLTLTSLKLFELYLANQS